MRWPPWSRRPLPQHPCFGDGCDKPSEPDAPFCADHGWDDVPGRAEFVAQDKARKQRAQDLAELERILDTAEELSSAAAYKLALAAGSAHPCQVGGCSLSQEEHHRLAYGYLNENRTLRRRIAELEGGAT